MNNADTLKHSKPIVRMKSICKSFGRVQVLKNVDLEVFPGEVHILAGENGAGKSTLIKILAGVHTDFQGTVEIDERGVRPSLFNGRCQGGDLRLSGKAAPQLEGKIDLTRAPPATQEVLRCVTRISANKTLVRFPVIPACA